MVVGQTPWPADRKCLYSRRFAFFFLSPLCVTSKGEKKLTCPPRLAHFCIHREFKFLEMYYSILKSRHFQILKVITPLVDIFVPRLFIPYRPRYSSRSPKDPHLSPFHIGCTQKHDWPHRAGRVSLTFCTDGSYV